MKTAIFLADGFEEIEGLTVVDVLRRAKIVCDMISTEDDLEINGSHGIKIKADYMISEINFDEYDCMILPGGKVGTQRLEANQYLLKRLDEFINAGKLVCAICAAPTILGHKGYLNGKEAVCYPTLEAELAGANVPAKEVAHDGNIITSRGMGTSIAFAGEIVKTVLDKETADELLKSLVYKQF